MIGNLNVVLKIFQENKILASQWTLQIFELHGIDGKVTIEENDMTAEMTISEYQLQKLLRTFKIRRTNYEIVSRS